MSQRFVTVVSLGLAGLLGAAGAASAQQATADEWVLSHTPWGDPDIQGIWNNVTATRLERPEEFADRRDKWQPLPPNYTTGALAKYAKLVSSAAEGAVTR